MEEAPRNSGLAAATLRLRRPRSLPGGVSGSYVQPQHPLPTTLEGVPRPLRWSPGSLPWLRGFGPPAALYRLMSSRTGISMSPKGAMRPSDPRTLARAAFCRERASSLSPGKLTLCLPVTVKLSLSRAAPTPLLWPIRPDPAPPTAAGLPPDSLPTGTWGRAPRHAEGEVPAPEGSPGNQGEQAHGATSGFPLRVPCRGPTSPRGKGPAPWALSVVLVVIPGVSSPSLRVCKQSAGERLARILRSASRAGRDSGTSKLLVSKVPQFPRPPRPRQHCRTAEPSADGKGRAKCQKFPPETVEGVFVGFSLPLACRKPQGNKTPAEMPRPPPAGGARRGCELRPPAPCPPALPAHSVPARQGRRERAAWEGRVFPPTAEIMGPEPPVRTLAAVALGRSGSQQGRGGKASWRQGCQDRGTGWGAEGSPGHTGMSKAQRPESTRKRGQGEKPGKVTSDLTIKWSNKHCWMDGPGGRARCRGRCPPRSVG
ncbi:uncharacterized protein LOC144313588 [Canis aureus]